MLLLAAVLLCAVCPGTGTAPPASPFYMLILPTALVSRTDHRLLVEVAAPHTAPAVCLRIESHAGPRSAEQSAVLQRGRGLVSYRVPFEDARELHLNISAVACPGPAGPPLFATSARLSVLAGVVQLFVETSKPIYRPGEVVRLRALALNLKTLRPAAAPLDLVVVEAPGRVRLQQWSNVDWRSALRGFRFRLSADPPPGRWRVVVRLGAVTEAKAFSVQRYVLSPLVVHLEPPAAMWFGTQRVRFRVCAEYSSGRPLPRARIVARLCVLPPRPQPGPVRPCLVARGQLEAGARCFQFNRSTAPLRLQDPRYRSWGAYMRLNATVTEPGSNRSVTRSMHGSRLMPIRLRVLDLCTTHTFRPALPFYGRVRVQAHGGRPAQGVRLDCFVLAEPAKPRWGWAARLRTDANGDVPFAIPPAPADRYTLRAIFSVPGGRPMLHIVLRRLHAPSGVALQIVPPSRAAAQDPCAAGRITLRLQATVPLQRRALRAVVAARWDLVAQRLLGPEPESAATLCEDSDRSDTGHFTCLPPNGPGMEPRVRCRPGWDGPNCATAVCSPPCDRGECARPGRCLCLPGWAGRRCERCLRAPDCVHGRCRHGFDCHCLPGWAGFRCDLRDPKAATAGPAPGPTAPSPSAAKPRPGTAPSPSAAPPRPGTVPEPGPVRPLQLFSRTVTLQGLPRLRLFPAARVVLWFVHRAGNRTAFVAAEAQVSAERCLAPAEFRFLRAEVRPGARISAAVTPTGQDAHCALSIADTALDAHEKRRTPQRGTGLSAKGVARRLWLLRGTATVRDPYADLLAAPCSADERAWRRMVMQPLPDASAAFSAAGLLVLSRVPVVTAPCAHPDPKLIRSRSGVAASLFERQRSALRRHPRRPRSHFPESWRFELLAPPPPRLNLTAPDSLTSWRASMFCVSAAHGLGVSPPALLRVRQAVHLRLVLPYTMARGQTARVPVTALSYAPGCLAVRLSLSAGSNAPGLTVAREGPAPGRPLCLCRFGAATVHFRVSARRLGRPPLTARLQAAPSRRCPGPSSGRRFTDAVRRRLRIEAEGVARRTVSGDLLCPRRGSLSRSWHLLVPPGGAVPDSARAYLAFSGSLLGPAVEHLAALVRLPFGCGEQNLARLVPSVRVLDLLTVRGATNASAADRRLAERARAAVRLGYQRQLRYRRPDGSFSAFGVQDRRGSAWLTALTLRGLGAAARHVRVDGGVLAAARRFLLTAAGPDGCFREAGRLLDPSLRAGGAACGCDALTGFVLAVLAEARAENASWWAPAAADAAAGAVRCLASGPDVALLGTFALALRAYALTLWAPHSDFTRRHLEQLRARLRRDGDVAFWASGVGAGDVETTAFALLALLTARGTDTQSGGGLAALMPAVRWMVQRRNERGGWSSTRDTLTALHALAAFSTSMDAATGGGRTALAVTVAVDGGRGRISNISAEDSLVLRRRRLPVASRVRVTVAGRGCLFVQTTLLFNVPVAPRAAAFALNASAAACDGLELCVAYVGPGGASNMALVTVRPPAGWEVTREALARLRGLAAVRRIDVDATGALVLYFDQLGAAPLCLRIGLQRRVRVEPQEPALVRVVDYYRPAETAEVPVLLCSGGAVP